MDGDDEIDTKVESWLRAARPKPDPRFMQELDARLFPPPVPRRLARVRPALAGSALAGSLAAGALVLGFAGAGPLSGGDDSGRADTDCRYVSVMKRGRVPVVVERNGRPHLTYRHQLVKERVRRCG